MTLPMLGRNTIRGRTPRVHRIECAADDLPTQQSTLRPIGAFKTLLHVISFPFWLLLLPFLAAGIAIRFVWLVLTTPSDPPDSESDGLAWDAQLAGHANRRLERLKHLAHQRLRFVSRN